MRDAFVFCHWRKYQHVQGEETLYPVTSAGFLRIRYFDMLVSYTQHSVVHLNFLPVECLINSNSAFGFLMVFRYLALPWNVFHGTVFTFPLLCFDLLTLCYLAYFLLSASHYLTLKFFALEIFSFAHLWKPVKPNANSNRPSRAASNIMVWLGEVMTCWWRIFLPSIDGVGYYWCTILKGEYRYNTFKDDM